MNLHWHRRNASFEDIEDYHADLILLNAFAGAAEIVDILNKEAVFDHARIVEKTLKAGSFHRLHSFLGLISPMHYLRYNHSFSRGSVYNRYDVLVVPKYNTMVGAIWRVNKKADLHLYEDGLGTYYLNTDLLKPHSRSYRFLYEKGFAKDFTNFSRLYLNAPELYSGTWNKDIRAVPKYDRNYLKKVQSYFADYSNTVNEEKKDIYWLSQTLENDEAIRTIAQTLNRLKKYKERVLYCPHPRWPEKTKPEFDVSNEKQIWEMKLLNMEDVDHKLFVSIHSTACLTPKLLFDDEPYLILFYQLIDDAVTERNERFDRTIRLFIDSYRDKEKVMLPRTQEEFEACLDRFTKSVEKK